jgi:hypothetical protein
MEIEMKLPIQSAPVMRGQDRSIALPSQAPRSTIAPSQLVPTPGTGGICPVCQFLPPPYNTICQLVCPIVPINL